MVEYTHQLRFAKWTYRRCRFWKTLGNIATDRLTENADFGKKIIFTDEVHFVLGGYVNKQNCRIWGTENRTHTLKSSYILVQRLNWAIFLRKWAKRGCYIQRRSLSGHVDRGHVVLLTKIEEEDIGNIWFLQDGAKCHTVEATLDVLRPVFEDRIISRKADAVWPPRHYDLTPSNYFYFLFVRCRQS